MSSCPQNLLHSCHTAQLRQDLDLVIECRVEFINFLYNSLEPILGLLQSHHTSLALPKELCTATHAGWFDDPSAFSTDPCHHGFLFLVVEGGGVVNCISGGFWAFLLFRHPPSTFCTDPRRHGLLFLVVEGDARIDGVGDKFVLHLIHQPRLDDDGGDTVLLEQYLLRV